MSNIGVINDENIGNLRTGLVFDGKYDYVDCGNDASLNMTKEITVMSLVKVNGSTNNYQMFFSKIYNKAWAIGMHKSGEYFVYYTRREGTNSADIGFAGIPEIGKIQFLTMTYHYQQGKNAYLNGEKIAHWDLVGELAISSYDVWIGKEATGNYPANVNIYFVALYNRAISDDEIRQMYDYVISGKGEMITDGLVLWLDGDSIGDDNVWYDKSGNGNNGEIHRAKKISMIGDY